MTSFQGEALRLEAWYHFVEGTLDLTTRVKKTHLQAGKSVSVRAGFECAPHGENKGVHMGRNRCEFVTGIRNEALSWSTIHQL
jgi:uncharacterized cupin superfamily protein